MNCKGISGFLFGHLYTTIYDKEQEFYSAEDRERILASIGKYNLGTTSSTEIDPDENDFLRIKKSTCKYTYCERCGHLIENGKI